MTIVHDGEEYTFAVNGRARVTVCAEFPDLPSPLQDVVRSLLEVAVAYVALGRLGSPASGDVLVEIDGPLREQSFPVIGRLLGNIMRTRNAVAGRDARGDVQLRVRERLGSKVRTALDETRVLVPSSGGMDSTAVLLHLDSRGLSPVPVFLEYDEGHDSFVKYERGHERNVVSHLGLERSDPQKVILSQLKDSKKTPWNTDQYGVSFSLEGAVQDTDRWELWGRDLALAASLLGTAIVCRTRHIDFGHTKETMFSLYQKPDGRLFYDRCCRSLHTLVAFNSVLADTFTDPPVVVASLRDATKGAIAGYLLQKPEIFALTRSCIGNKPTECGYCFSCTDKIASIVSNTGRGRLLIERDANGRTTLVWEGMPLATFSWFPSRLDGGVWGKQLTKLLDCPEVLPVNLRHSIYRPEAMLAALHVLDQKGLREFIPDEYYAVKSQIGTCDRLDRIQAGYVMLPGFRLPEQFVRDSEGLVRAEHVL